MQIWIYFQPGVGGDGFANLLEKATNVSRYDSFKHPWHIHRRVDNQIKFFFPAIDRDHCFRKQQTFNKNNNQLIQSYVDCVTKNKIIICTCHDVRLRFFKQHDCQEILTKNLVKVLLTCDDYQSAWDRAAIKNLYTGPVDSIFRKKVNVNPEQFDHVLNIDRINNDWEYVKFFCQTVGLDLHKSAYQDYLELLAGSTQFDYPGVEVYKSNIVNGIISYVKITS